jgi:hypothetical protein
MMIIVIKETQERHVKEIMDQLLLLKLNLFSKTVEEKEECYWSLLVKGFLEKIMLKYGLKIRRGRIVFLFYFIEINL